MRHAMLSALVFSAACHVPPPAPPPAAKPDARCHESIEVLIDKGRAECPPGTVLHSRGTVVASRMVMIAACDCPAPPEDAPAASPSAPPGSATSF